MENFPSRTYALTHKKTRFNSHSPPPHHRHQPPVSSSQTAHCLPARLRLDGALMKLSRHMHTLHIRGLETALTSTLIVEPGLKTTNTADPSQFVVISNFFTGDSHSDWSLARSGDRIFYHLSPTAIDNSRHDTKNENHANNVSCTRQSYLLHALFFCIFMFATQVL